MFGETWFYVRLMQSPMPSNSYPPSKSSVSFPRYSFPSEREKGVEREREKREEGRERKEKRFKKREVKKQR